MGRATALTAALGLLVGLFALGATPAMAGKKVDRFFPVDGVSGSLGGQFSTPRGVAIHEATGRIFVADDDNHRIQRFSAAGIFERAWGRDVIQSGKPGDLGTAVLEVCTVAADCKAGSTGTASDGPGGELDNPQGVAVDQSTGHVYVRDADNLRVQEFTADGAFVRAWGGDVVQPGGTGEAVGPAVDEQQTVTIGRIFGIATGGSFRLTFDGQQTDPAIPYNATPAAVDAALESLSTVGPGNVVVTSSNPGGGSSAGGPWTVTFTGALGGTNVPEMIGDGSGLTGSGFGGTASVAQTRQGGPSPGFEVCTVAAECQKGASGSQDGFFGVAVGPVGTVPQRGTGIAVHPATGDVFVVDAGGPENRRIQQFEADGDFAAKFGSVGSGVGQFDNPTTSLNTPQPQHVAVDSSGIVYASDIHDGGRVQRYDSIAGQWLQPISGGPSTPLGPGSTTALSVDGDDHLYVARGSSGPIRELDLSSNPAVVTSAHVVDTHLVDSGLSPAGLALNDATGDLAVSSSTSGHRVFVADDDGAGQPDAILNQPTDVTASSARVSATVNPEGFPSSYRFEFSRDGVSWIAAKPDESIGSGTADVDVDDELTGLTANSLYRVRLVVTKGFGAGTAFSPELTFATDTVAPSVTTLPDRGASATATTLEGRINPNNLPTTYFFEYGRSTAYGEKAPVPSGSAGTGGTVVAVAQQISGLTPKATYHFRLCATNGQPADPGDTAAGTVVCGADRQFATRAPAAPPPGRGYELVSPPDKLSGIGAGVAYQGPASASGTGFAAYDGERFAVQGNTGATLLDGAFSFANDWAFAERRGDDVGWVSHSPITRGGYGSQNYRFIFPQAMSDDLSLTAWRSNGGLLRLFSEQEAWPEVTVSALSSWDGRWELFGPTDPSQAVVGQGELVDAVVAPDAPVVTGSSPAMRGLMGPGDPTLDLPPGTASVYVDSLLGGLSDTFPGTGVRVVANVCTGTGADRTLLPARQASGLLAAEPCAAAPPGRDARLTSDRGAGIGSASSASSTPLDNAISEDGSRVFFMSSDPRLPGSDSPCGTGAQAGSCPSQVFVAQLGADGRVATTRWLSRPRVAGQDASLLGPAYFEGASSDGRRVFFRTNSPLTADDPNGGGSPPPGGVTTGTASDLSWDLYMYEFPADEDADLGDGTLIRISAGPEGGGDGDCNSPFDGGQGSPALRSASDDGARVYFVCAAPLADVPGASNGTITAPAGSPSTSNTTNLYVYDADRQGAARWRYVALLPRSVGEAVAACASTGTRRANPLEDPAATTGHIAISSGRDCVRGTSDGRFVVFWTNGRLVAGDPDSTSGDIYGYDLTADKLTRLSAPQGGIGGTYTCVTAGDAAGSQCHGDGGFDTSDSESKVAKAALGVATEPLGGSRQAFFQSRSRLVAEDSDEAYDVYQWRDGDLSLVTTGNSGSDGAFYRGNDRTGRNVYLATRDQLTWQDHDRVLDVYTARIGGGIPQPAPPSACGVLAGGCQSGGTSPIATRIGSDGPDGVGDALSGPRKRLTVAGLSAKARQLAARRGVLRVRVRTSTAGRVRAVATGRIGSRTRRLARESVLVRSAGSVTLKLRLSRPAKSVLRGRKTLTLSVEVSSPGARSRSMTVRLPGGKS